MNRANCSAKEPNRSESTAGRRTSERPTSERRTSCGWSRRARTRSSLFFSATFLSATRRSIILRSGLRGSGVIASPLLDLAVAPAVGQQVVQQVVDGDGAEQPALVVDHRGGDQVVGGQEGRHVLQAGVGVQ